VVKKQKISQLRSQTTSRGKPKGEILALAISPDGKYLASGGSDQMVRIWDPRTPNSLVHSFRGHRGTISGLAFRKDSLELLSASFDRTLKLWNLNEMSYIDTFYGHTDEVTCLVSGKKEKALTGGNDFTCRVWKVVDQTQLLYKAHEGYVDSVAYLNDELFVSGSQDGSIAVWNSGKKKTHRHSKSSTWNTGYN